VAPFLLARVGRKADIEAVSPSPWSMACRFTFTSRRPTAIVRTRVDPTVLQVNGVHVESGQPHSPRLVRRLTLMHAVLYGIGVTIGAGVYVLVGVAAGRSGMYAPLGFLAAAVAMGFTAASFAELGTRMPVSASEAAYVQAAFGRRWLTTAMGLLVVVTATISAATIAAGSVGYIGIFVPLPTHWIIIGVVLSMGAVSCLATTQSIMFAGVMTLIEV